MLDALALNGADPLMRTAGDIAMRVGVAKETAPGERRVALVPEAVEKLRAADIGVLVERGAGVEAWFPDTDYAVAGAEIVTASDLYSQSDVIVRIHRPTPAEMKNQVVIGMLAPLLDPAAMAELARMEVTAISLDAIPRTLSRSQGMDALSSQANVAGYKAVLVAAEAYGRYFPLLTTAAGTARPANVLVLGVGVAGLQAIATARRAYDLSRTFFTSPEEMEWGWWDEKKRIRGLGLPADVAGKILSGNARRWIAGLA